jgi:hypothetical protein
MDRHFFLPSSLVLGFHANYNQQRKIKKPSQAEVPLQITSVFPFSKKSYLRKIKTFFWSAARLSMLC